MNPAHLQVSSSSSSSNLTVNQSGRDMREKAGPTQRCTVKGVSLGREELGRLISNDYLWSPCRKKQG